jgi:hypothetical protein
MHRFYIDGHKVDQLDRFGNGTRWFGTMLLPDVSIVAGPFTPVEFARHRAWGIDPKWATRCAIHAPMQDVNDKYNKGFWPMQQCEPSEVLVASARHSSQRDYRACVFSYADPARTA